MLSDASRRVQLLQPNIKCSDSLIFKKPSKAQPQLLDQTSSASNLHLNMSASPDNISRPGPGEHELHQTTQLFSPSQGGRPQRRPNEGCRCFCTCSGCLCNSNGHHASNLQPNFSANLDLEFGSLASEFSELTFGESWDSRAEFDLSMLSDQQEDHAVRQTGSIDAEMNENEDIDLEAVGNNPQAYFLDRRHSGDNDDLNGEEILIFGEINLDGSMIVNLSEEDETMMWSYASALSPSSGNSSALVKDVGAIFNTDQLLESKRVDSHE